MPIDEFGREVPAGVGGSSGGVGGGASSSVFADPLRRGDHEISMGDAAAASAVTSNNNGDDKKESADIFHCISPSKKNNIQGVSPLQEYSLKLSRLDTFVQGVVRRRACRH